MANDKPSGPNQGNDKNNEKAGAQHQQDHGSAKAPSQHDGGVGNLQDEPQTAEEAKKRAAEKAHKK